MIFKTRKYFIIKNVCQTSDKRELTKNEYNYSQIFFLFLRIRKLGFLMFLLKEKRKFANKIYRIQIKI